MGEETTIDVQAEDPRSRPDSAATAAMPAVPNAGQGVLFHDAHGYAERLWIRAIFAGEPMDMGWRARMFELPEGWSRDEIVGFYRAETGRVDAVLDQAAGFDLPSRGDLRPTTLRWAVMHLIEETARHVGHMDITRELLDGTTGR